MQRASAHRGGELEREKRTYGKNGEKSGPAEKSLLPDLCGNDRVPASSGAVDLAGGVGKAVQGAGDREYRARAGDGWTELLSDVEFMSMRLSQLISANDNMVIRYAVEVDSTSNDRKHEYQKKLDHADRG